MISTTLTRSLPLGAIPSRRQRYPHANGISSMSSIVARDLLLKVAEMRTTNFCGVGVVLYRSLCSVPFMALGDGASCAPALPVVGLEPIADVLASISIPTSRWHDGFHLIDVTTTALTHLSQYISPGIPTNSDTVILPRPSGARRMTALLVSRLHGIDCAALLTQWGELCVFDQGNLVFTTYAK